SKKNTHQLVSVDASGKLKTRNFKAPEFSDAINPLLVNEGRSLVLDAESQLIIYDLANNQSSSVNLQAIDHVLSLHPSSDGKKILILGTKNHTLPHLDRALSADPRTPRLTSKSLVAMVYDMHEGRQFAQDLRSFEVGLAKGTNYN